jgi:hypothetical protein
MDQLWVMGAGVVWKCSEFIILEEEKRSNSTKLEAQRTKE